MEGVTLKKVSEDTFEVVNGTGDGLEPRQHENKTVTTSLELKNIQIAAICEMNNSEVDFVDHLLEKNYSSVGNHENTTRYAIYAESDPRRLDTEFYHLDNITNERNVFVLRKINELRFSILSGKPSEFEEKTKIYLSTVEWSSGVADFSVKLPDEQMANLIAGLRIDPMCDFRVSINFKGLALDGVQKSVLLGKGWEIIYVERITIESKLGQHVCFEDESHDTNVEEPLPYWHQTPAEKKHNQLISELESLKRYTSSIYWIALFTVAYIIFWQ